MTKKISNFIPFAMAVLFMTSFAVAQDTPVPDDESKPVAEQQAQPETEPAAVPAAQEPAPEKKVISSQKCPHQLLWYADGVYAYSMKTLVKSGDGWLPNDEEMGTDVAFFAEEIKGGANDKDGNCVCNSEAKPIGAEVVVDPTKPMGFIQGRSDFRSNYYKAGDNHYQAVYFTMNGKNKDGESRTYQYRVAFPCKGAPAGDGSVNVNAVKLDGKTLVVENPEDAKEGVAAARYPLFGSAQLVGEEEKVEAAKVEEVQPEPVPADKPEEMLRSDTPVPDGGGAVDADGGKDKG